MCVKKWTSHIVTYDYKIKTRTAFGGGMFRVNQKGILRNILKFNLKNFEIIFWFEDIK